MSTLEVAPVDTGTGRELSAVDLFTATPALFERAGFHLHAPGHRPPGRDAQACIVAVVMPYVISPPPAR